MKRLTITLLTLLVLGCATTESNKLKRTITGYTERNVAGFYTSLPDGTYKGYINNYEWDCYGLREYGNGDIYSGEWTTTGSIFPRPIRSGKGITVKPDGSIISGEWRDDEIFSEFYISAEDLRLLANSCAERYSKITRYWMPVEDFKASVKQEAAFWGGAAETVVTAALVTTAVVAAIAESPAGQAALANKQAKNQKAREQAAYNKGKRDGKRKAARQKKNACMMKGGRNC